VVIEHRYAIDETLLILGNVFEARLAKSHPGNSLFLILAQSSQRFLQPMLLDRAKRRCVWLSPAALSTATEPGFALTKSLRGLSTMIFEGYVLAIIKNPVSSAARLVNLVDHFLTSLIRLPLPKAATKPPPLVKRQGMDLAEWEHWLARLGPCGAFRRCCLFHRDAQQTQVATCSLSGHQPVRGCAFASDENRLETIH
jgi:hypothetical protein